MNRTDIGVDDRAVKLRVTPEEFFQLMDLIEKCTRYFRVLFPPPEGSYWRLRTAVRSDGRHGATDKDVLLQRGFNEELFASEFSKMFGWEVYESLKALKKPVEVVVHDEDQYHIRGWGEQGT